MPCRRPGSDAECMNLCRDADAGDPGRERRLQETGLIRVQETWA